MNMSESAIVLMLIKLIRMLKTIITARCFFIVTALCAQDDTPVSQRVNSPVKIEGSVRLLYTFCQPALIIPTVFICQIPFRNFSNI